MAEWQNASYNKCVSRVRIPMPVDHVTTACPKACANAKYIIAKLSMGSACKDKNPGKHTLVVASILSLGQYTCIGQVAKC